MLFSMVRRKSSSAGTKLFNNTFYAIRIEMDPLDNYTVGIMTSFTLS